MRSSPGLSRFAPISTEGERLRRQRVERVHAGSRLMTALPGSGGLLSVVAPVAPLSHAAREMEASTATTHWRDRMHMRRMSTRDLIGPS